MLLLFLLGFLAPLCPTLRAEIYFKETFEETPFGDPFEKRWIQSRANASYGRFRLGLPTTYGDENINRGMITAEDQHQYAISAKFKKPFDNKNKTLVLSYTVKYDQDHDCGGGYIKLMPDIDQEEFDGKTPYFIMFGPDICGPWKVQIMWNYQGVNVPWLKEPKCKRDKLTHLYTLIIRPDNTYEVRVDNEYFDGGEIERDWELLPEPTLDDTTDEFPDDYDEGEEWVTDPDDKKPDDWDREPKKIPDPDVDKPEDWDDDEDGNWTAPLIDNKNAKGHWFPGRIKNPNYKPFQPQQLHNPLYHPDPYLYWSRKPLNSVGFELWNVKNGTVFDNIIVSDSVEEVEAFIAETWGKTIEKEKELEEIRDKEEDAERKRERKRERKQRRKERQEQMEEEQRKKDEERAETSFYEL